MKICERCQQPRPSSNYRNSWKICRCCLKADALLSGTCINCLARPAALPDTYCGQCREIKRVCDRKRHEKDRAAALSAYSDTLSCSCCSEARLPCLTIDHVNNDGADHRREIGSGAAIYSWLKKNAYPGGFQTLCWNCNSGKRLGLCPHHPDYRPIVPDNGYKRYHAKLRLEVLSRYSGGDPKCGDCGIIEMMFLTVDHTHGDGNNHRRTIKCSIYKWLKRQNYPDGFGVLCYNCNHAKHLNLSSVL